MPQTFFPNSPYSQKYDLIRLTPYHCNRAFRKFVTSQNSLLQISTDSLSLQVQVVAAKFPDLVIGYSLLPVDNRVSSLQKFLQNYAFL